MEYGQRLGQLGAPLADFGVGAQAGKAAQPEGGVGKGGLGWGAPGGWPKGQAQVGKDAGFKGKGGKGVPFAKGGAPGKGMPPGDMPWQGAPVGAEPPKTREELADEQDRADLEYRKALRKFDPKHGQLSRGILAMAIVCVVLSLFSLLVPYWRKNDFGTPWYPYSRGWGLFNIMGMKSQSLKQFRDKACRSYGGLKVGNFCLSPICKWYKLKCEVYTDIMWASFGTGLLKIIGLIIQLLALWWTFKLTPRMVRWSSIWRTVAAVVEISGLIVYAVLTEWMLDSLNKEGIYPEQTFGISFIFAGIGCVLMIISGVCTFLLRKVHPEDDESDDESETESSDLAEEEEVAEVARAAPLQVPPPQPEATITPLHQWQEPSMPPATQEQRAPGMPPQQQPSMPPLAQEQWAPAMPQPPQQLGSLPGALQQRPVGADLTTQDAAPPAAGEAPAAAPAAEDTAGEPDAIPAAWKPNRSTVSASG